MTSDVHRQAARLLLSARADRRPIEALPAACRPEGTADAYAIQDTMVAARGEPVAGYKIGATNPKVQDYMGIDEPFYGRIFASGVHDSPAMLSAGAFNFRLIEPEFAFRLGSDLPARAAAYTAEEVAGAVASLHPAIEVIDSAFGEAWVNAGAPSLTADNGIHGAFVLGPGIADWRALGLATHRVALWRNGTQVEQGVGGNAMGHPLNPLAWLADQASHGGPGLRAGEVITTGVVTPFIYAEAGDDIRADFGPLGEVRISFTD